MSYKSFHGDETPKADPELLQTAMDLRLHVINVMHVGDKKTGEGFGATLFLTPFVPRVGETISTRDRKMGVVAKVWYVASDMTLPSGKTAFGLVVNVILKNDEESAVE